MPNMSFVLNNQLRNESTRRPMDFYFPPESQVSPVNRSFIPSFDSIRPLLSRDFVQVPGYSDFRAPVPARQPLSMTYRGVMPPSPQMVNLSGVNCTAWHTPLRNYPRPPSGFRSTPTVCQLMKSLPVSEAVHRPVYVHSHFAHNNHNHPLPAHPPTGTFPQSFLRSDHSASPLQMDANVGYPNATPKTVKGLAPPADLPPLGAASHPMVTMVSSPGTPQLVPTLSNLLFAPVDPLSWSTRRSSSPPRMPTQSAAPVKSSNFQCPHCPFSASTDGRLQRHIDQRHHAGQAPQPPPLLPCPDTALVTVTGPGQAGSRPDQAVGGSDSPVSSLPRQSEPGQTRSDAGNLDDDDDEVIVTAVTQVERQPADERRAAGDDDDHDGAADSPYHRLTDETCSSSSESSSDGVSDIEDDPRSESLLAWLRLNRSALCAQADSVQQTSVPEPLSPRSDPRLSPLLLDMSMFSDGESTPGLLPSDCLGGFVPTDLYVGGVATATAIFAQPMEADLCVPPPVSTAAAAPTGLGESAERRRVCAPRGSPSPVVPVVIDIPSPPSIIVKPRDLSAPTSQLSKSLVRRRLVKHAKRRLGQELEAGGLDSPLTDESTRHNDNNIFKCFEPSVTMAARRLSGEKMPTERVTCGLETQSYFADPPRSPPKLFKESPLDTDFILSTERTNRDRRLSSNSEVRTMRTNRVDKSGELAADKNISPELQSPLSSQCPEPAGSSPFLSPPLLISNVEIGEGNLADQPRLTSELIKPSPANEDGNTRPNSKTHGRMTACTESLMIDFPYSPPTLPSMPYPIRGRTKLTAFPTDDPKVVENVPSEFDLPLEGYPESHKLIMVDTSNADVYVKGHSLQTLTSSSVTRTKRNQVARQTKRIPAASEGSHFVERCTEMSPPSIVNMHEASRRRPSRSRSKVLVKSPHARAPCDVGEDVYQPRSAAATARHRQSPAEELSSPPILQQVDASTITSPSRLVNCSSSSSSMLLMAAFHLTSDGEVIATAPPRQ